MITLTLELDFPESENSKVMQKLSELLEKTKNVKIKELRIGDSPKIDPYYPTLNWPNTISTSGPTNIPGSSITYTYNSADSNEIQSNSHSACNLQIFDGLSSIANEGDIVNVSNENRYAVSSI